MRYSIVIPIYFDGYLAPYLCKTIEQVMTDYTKSKDLSKLLELIFINDGSTDGSIEILVDLSKKYKFVKVIDLSRNFGQHVAIACGLHEAKGDMVLRMNVDMQDHPSEIPKLIDAMLEENLDLVVGQYSIRKSPLINRITAKLYFRTFRLLTGFSSPQNTSPLRVMSRRFVNAYNQLTEKSRFPQGLDQWLGFNIKYIRIEHNAREDGKSSYNMRSRLALAIEGILYFSDRPLTIMVSFGFLVSLLGIALAFVIMFAWLIGTDFIPGFVSLVSIGLIAFGVQLGCTGIVGLYVAKSFKEVQNRPLYLIKDIYENTIQE